MKYQVPQFIEVEDKIFGPFTFKQFVYMIGGLGVCFIAYKLLPFFWAIIVMLPAVGISGSLAFYRPNNRPFIDTLEAAFNYMLTAKLYIWKREDKKIEPRAAQTAIQSAQKQIVVPKLTEGKLRDLAWSLDINETTYSRDRENGGGTGQISQLK